MPGSFCTVVGCPANSSRYRGLSFFSIRRPDNVEWEKALVHSINRVDGGFNKDKAKICSRHFLDKCFKNRGLQRVLIPGSIPTEHMPTISMPTKSSRHPEVHPQVLPLFPEPSEVAAYYSLEEILTDAKKLTYPWCILQMANEFFRLGFISDENQGENLLITITVRDALVAHVIFLGNEVRTQNLKEMRLVTFLDKLTSQNRCPGILDLELQEFASLPMSEKDVYFRHLTYGFSEGRLKSNSTVRSVKCVYFTIFDICTFCGKVKVLLLKKAKRELRNGEVIGPKTPLKFVSRCSLKRALMMTRKRNRKLESEIEEFKKTKVTIEDRTLDDGSEQYLKTSASIEKRTMENDTEPHRETYTSQLAVSMKLELEDDIDYIHKTNRSPSAVNIKSELEDDINQHQEIFTSPSAVNIKLELEDYIDELQKIKTPASAVNIKLEDDINEIQKIKTPAPVLDIKLELQDDVEQVQESKTSAENIMDISE